MKKILGLMFFVNFLLSCQVSTSKTAVTVGKIEKSSKANVTYNAEITNGICTNCD